MSAQGKLNTKTPNEVNTGFGANAVVTGRLSALTIVPKFG